MAITNKDITMYQKENKSLVFSIVGDTGIKNLTGGDAKFVLSDRNVPIVKTVDNGGILISSNTLTVLLEANDTLDKSGRFSYELRANDIDGNSEVVAVGKIEIKKSTTI